MFRQIGVLLHGNAVAWLALFFALSGTGLAASRYIITSTKQIKPSVLRELRGSGIDAVASSTKGTRAIIDRVRSTGPVATVSAPEAVSVPLENAVWSQAPEQANGIFGQITVTSPPSVPCPEYGYPEMEAQIFVDGVEAGRISIEARATEWTATYRFEWSAEKEYPLEGGTLWLLDSKTAATHTVTARAHDSCPGGAHFMIDSLGLDVLGVR